MRILVFSDSHGDSESILKVMDRFYPDVALHLGDGIDDLLVLEKDFPQTSFFHVRGDVDNLGDLNRFQVFDGVSIYMTHHQFQFEIKKDRDKMTDIKKLNAHIVLFGNTHTPTLFVCDGVTFMNPGSIGKAFSFRTFGMIDISEGDFMCEVSFADLFV